MDKLKEIINYLFSQKNYMSIAIIICSIVVFAAVLKIYVIPQYSSMKELNSDIDTNQERLEQLKASKKARDLEAKNNLVKIDEVPVKIYKAPTANVPTETASIDFVSTVIQKLENTNNSILDISYKIDALSDAEKSSVPRNVSVVQLTMTLNAAYENFENFISSLYHYDYVATIKSVKMTPLMENKNILELDVVIWLYVAK